MIDVVDYLPDPGVDAELADLGYTAVHGWPDQRPITASLVRSWLRPTGTTATTLVMHRRADGRLLAAAALRWPATLEATGRLWGPIVHPDARGNGLGSALLATLAEILAARPGVRVRTGEIPETRTAGWSLFERAGWHGSGTSCLLKRVLPADGGDPVGVPVRTIRFGEYVDRALASLFGAARPHLGHATARDTYTRWTADARYTPDGLLLADGPDGLLGAALVYPLSHVGRDEPSEALLADVIGSRQLDPAAAASVRSALVAAALDAGTRMGAAVARAVVDDPDLAATLRAAGFTDADQIRYYSPPAAARPRARVPSVTS